MFKEFKTGDNHLHLYSGDCLTLMDKIPDKSIHLICTDLPYAVTSNKQDIALPFDKLWNHYKRVIKDDGTIALFAQGIFYVDLVSSNRDMFKYDLIWDKVLTTGFLNAKKQPLRVHEQIAIFYKEKGVYNNQFTEKGKPLHSVGKSVEKKGHINNNYGNHKGPTDHRAGETQKYPKSILTFQKPHPSKTLHRTEKSIKVLEWLIKTYSNENNIVLDNTAGSFTCAIAAANTKRNFIGMELNEEYYKVGVQRIKDTISQKLF